MSVAPARPTNKNFACHPPIDTPNYAAILHAAMNEMITFRRARYSSHSGIKHRYFLKGFCMRTRQHSSSCGIHLTPVPRRRHALRCCTASLVSVACLMVLTHDGQAVSPLQSAQVSSPAIDSIPTGLQNRVVVAGNHSCSVDAHLCTQGNHACAPLPVDLERAK